MPTAERPRRHSSGSAQSRLAEFEARQAGVLAELDRRAIIAAQIASTFFILPGSEPIPPTQSRRSPERKPNP